MAMWMLSNFVPTIHSSMCLQPPRTHYKRVMSLNELEASLFLMLISEVGNLDLAYRAETAGVFDIKWNPVVGDTLPLLALADADGYLRIHRLGCCLNGSEVPGHCLEDVWSEHVSSSMCLCLEWDPSGSSVTVGSDDCKFSCWDLRDDSSNMVFQNSKVHEMGICCITKNPSDTNTLLTGSYDEHLRVWGLRSMLRPINETSIVVKTKGDEPEVIERYGKHGSLAYGADWHRGKFTGKGKKGNRALVATCSFYDRLLRVWMPECDLTLFD
ncbi:OLC1v1008675C1 [Oldenlandia corymbosa var. corymbosa]|uniref:methylated diphthine methylhydrolase n=1 Tax=Oldenlandia corymbosa var. corymbosa TaxID=529605 RepID=A0AAV1DPL7_OLDCO|nr:OLC1v1008675C1 [Oldenlandia corymbosa var. corymbosa]